MTYTYRAANRAARIIKGRIEAASEQELGEKLVSQGLTLIEASRENILPKRAERLGEKDLQSFTYFLHLVITSGISLMTGLNDIAQQTENRKISNAASLLQEKIESGKSIADSMIEYPEIFPSFYARMVRAGELSGNLERVLSDILSYLEWHIQFRKDIRSALSYPLIVLSAVACLVLVLFVFVIPRFVNILTGLNTELPLPTKVLVLSMNFITGYWPLITLFLILIPVLYGVFYRTPRGRYFIDALILKTPLIGNLSRKLNHSRYFRTFATLYGSGFQMDETLKVSSDTVKNTVIADTFRTISLSVLSGEEFSSALRNSGAFAPLLLNMVEIGEKAGALDTTMLKICDIYEKEIPETLKRIFLVLEPIMIALLGTLVLFTMLSFFLPLYKIISGIN